MSAATQPVDAIAELSAWIRRVGRMYACDLNAPSEEAFTSTLGGVTRSAQTYTAEVVNINKWVAKQVAGEEGAPDEAELLSKADAAKAIMASAEILASSIDSNRERLCATVTAPWGEPMTAFAFANIAANHMMYHDGHLTMTQMVNGDSAIHWFDKPE